MNCLVYKTDPAECLGGAGREAGCNNRERPGVAHEVSGQITRLLRLQNMRANGARFAPADLYAEDWLGLEALAEYRQRKAAPPADD